MTRERKYLRNPCVVCGKEQIGLHHHEKTPRRKKSVQSDVDFIMRYEGEGEVTTEEERAFFQKGVNDGSIWSLQGFYGRRAAEMLNAGEIDYPKKKTTDAYGNKIPTQADIKKQFGKYQSAKARRRLKDVS